MINTNPLYWDCECETHYVHSKELNYCTVCKTYAEDSPDSRVNEVKYQYRPEEGIETAIRKEKS